MRDHSIFMMHTGNGSESAGGVWKKPKSLQSLLQAGSGAHRRWTVGNMCSQNEQNGLRKQKAAWEVARQEGNAVRVWEGSSWTFHSTRSTYGDANGTCQGDVKAGAGCRRLCAGMETTWNTETRCHSSHSWSTAINFWDKQAEIRRR